MNQRNLVVASNVRIAEGIYRMALMGDTSDFARPGQFMNIRIDGKFLRRPISVFDKRDGVAEIIYKTVGSGTEIMSGLQKGKVLDVLCGLGNGFDTALSGDRPLLIGGGVGAPPMYWLAKKLTGEGKKVSVILGFNFQKDVILKDEFLELTPDVKVSTVDGSEGTKGFVTDMMSEGYTHYYACGPEPMLKAVHGKAATSGQLSFEARMGCGFGACMGCSCRTVTGYKRICREGPVLLHEEVLWQ